MLFGILIYLLVLMFFDSVEMLANNFFSREVLFVIGLTVIFFELNRLLIVLLNFFKKLNGNLVLRAGIQYLLAIILTISFISGALHLYFVNIEGFSTIHTELITFNSIYIFAALFYHLYYFSILFLFRKNDDLFLSERIKRDNLELELNAYKNQINPEFLFQTLEIIIIQLKSNKKKADELIDQLAKVYRYTLDNQNNELVTLKEELESLAPVLFIFQCKHSEAITVSTRQLENEDIFLVPGTLQILFEHAIMNSLINENIPLEFKILSKGEKLIISYNKNEKITKIRDHEFRLEHLSKTYDYLAKDGMRKNEAPGLVEYEIPLLAVEEE